MASNKKDVVILPPEILSRQSCTECHKYLSVGPVIVTRGGKMICGRCKVDSLYNQIAEKCLFPCINYDAGCRQLLSFNEAKDHELNCSGYGIISCPFCNYDGDELRLVQHFKEEHSEDVVDDKFTVVCQVGFSRNLIFLKDKHILCLTLVANGRFLKIYILLSPSTSKFKRFTFSFFKVDGGIHFVTPHIEAKSTSDDFLLVKGASCEENQGDVPYVQLGNCFLLAKSLLTVSLQSDPYYCRMDYVNDGNPGRPQPNNFEQLISNLNLLKLRPEDSPFKYIKQVGRMDVSTLRQFVKKEFREMQKCGKCKTYITDRNTAFFCPGHHLLCQNCIEGKCPECKAFVKWNRHSRWHDIMLYCEWDCNLQVNIFAYLQHVHSCPSRRYKCPDRGCPFVGVLDDIKKHWHMNQLKCGEHLMLEWKEQAFYWLLPDLKELIYVTVEMISTGQFLVTIYEEDAFFPTLYKFDIPGSVVEDWVSLKNQIGRYVKIKLVNQMYLYLNVKKSGTI